MNIIEAVRDRQLFRPFLADKHDSLASWSSWLTALRALYGLPVSGSRSIELIRQCAGRDASLLPEQGFQTGIFLVGRRGGKSRLSACIAAYEATLSGRHELLAAGEKGLVVCVAPSKMQAGIVLGYLKGLFNSTPMLRNEIAGETKEGLILANGVEIWVLSADWRTTRGFTLLACCIDECCFLGTDPDSKVRSDSELVRALKPSLSTTKGRLIAISSPYAERGWAYQQWKTGWGNDRSRTLIWRAPSRVMNPALDESIVQEAMQEDPASARSEYWAEWRQDVSSWLPREAILPCVVANRRELLPRANIRYVAFCDLSGGRGDSAGLAISHQDGDRAIVDCVREYRAPFSPQVVVADMADVLRSYGCRFVTGDNYSGEWVAQAFVKCGISYRRSDKPKSRLYLELLPRICSGTVELLDDPVLISQLCGLERRVRAGGKDVVDHVPGQRDDVANSVAGSVVGTSRPVFRVGFGKRSDTRERTLGRIGQRPSGSGLSTSMGEALYEKFVK
ncbi:MAG: hypothetical protein FJ276_31935 [Planctomycetes bacterium]|nr:hypothetical protein [Planctomycetota bacterium]